MIMIVYMCHCVRMIACVRVCLHTYAFVYGRIMFAYDCVISHTIVYVRIVTSSFVYVYIVLRYFTYVVATVICLRI